MNHQGMSEVEALQARNRELESDEAKWVQAEDTSTRLFAMVQSADDAIIGKTITGIVQTWNPGAERLYGYSAADMIGREMTILLPSDRGDEELFILERIARGERVDHFDTVRRRKDGRLINVSIAISPIMGRNGSIIGASHVARISPRAQISN